MAKKEDIIFRSKLPDIYIPKHLPLHAYCFEKLSEFGSRPCLINAPTGDVYTYYDVDLAARKVASGLNRLGVGRGEVIMILLPNSPEFVFAFLGASYRGAVATAANPFFTATEIAKQATASNAKLVITQASYRDKVKGLDATTKVVLVDSPSPPAEGEYFSFSELMEADENELPEVKVGLH